MYPGGWILNCTPPWIHYFWVIWLTEYKQICLELFFGSLVGIYKENYQKSAYLGSASIQFVELAELIVIYGGYF